MVNKNGSLSGWADPEDPNWQENLMELVAKRAPQRVNERRGRSTRGLDLPPDVWELVFAAAERDQVSRLMFMRRAVCAFAAQRLGMDVNELLQDCPGKQSGLKGVTRDRVEPGDGWRIVEVE